MTLDTRSSLRESFAMGLAAGANVDDTAGPEAKAPSLLKRALYPNIAGVVALILLPLTAFGVPWQGWALAFGAWVINRMAHVVTVGFTHKLPVTMAVGATGIAMMFRVWIIAAAFFIVGRTGDHREWALWGMGLFLILITIDISLRVITELKRRSNETLLEEPAT